jgi:hypothetical protein
VLSLADGNVVNSLYLKQPTLDFSFGQVTQILDNRVVYIFQSAYCPDPLDYSYSCNFNSRYVGLMSWDPYILTSDIKTYSLQGTHLNFVIKGRSRSTFKVNGADSMAFGMLDITSSSPKSYLIGLQ